MPVPADAAEAVIAGEEEIVRRAAERDEKRQRWREPQAEEAPSTPGACHGVAKLPPASTRGTPGRADRTALS